MKKNNLIITIITVVVCLLPIIAGAIVYDKLPDRMVIQVGLNNEPTNFASKNFVLFVNPLLMAGVQLILIFFSNRASKAVSKEPIFMKLVYWIIPVMAILIYYLIIMYNLYETINVGKITSMSVGILFCLLGNYIPKMSFENNVNLNFPAKDEKGFRKQIKILGYGLVIVGIIFITISFFV